MENELLQYAIENGIIDLSYMQKQIEMKKNLAYLQQHPYKIWQGKDGNWYTYFPTNAEVATARVQRKRTTKQALEELIIDYWKEESENPTVKDFYDRWVNEKLERGEITITTKNRYDRDFSAYAEEFGKKRIKSVHEEDIEDFMIESICKHSLTAKRYANLRTIIYGVFKKAKKNKYVCFNIVETVQNIDISRKLFRRVKRDDENVVFMRSEQPLVEDYILNQHRDICTLGILLAFKTGLRPGELSALKWVDVNETSVHINRTEIRYQDAGGKYVYEVRDFPKTEAGIRDVVIPVGSLWILDEIRALNPDGEYVFMKTRAGKKNRIKTCQFDKVLRRICDNVGITRKSMNKIRKTYATILIDGDVDDAVIISQMGHTDIATTKKYYYKNRNNLRQREEIINQVSGL